MDKKKIETLAAEIRLETLKVIHSRGFGHVGGSMDLADLMAVLYGEVMHFDPKNPAIPTVTGWCSARATGPAALRHLRPDGLLSHGGRLYPEPAPHQGSPATDRKLTLGVDPTTGSLGRGASTAAGAAPGQ